MACLFDLSIKGSLAALTTELKKWRMELSAEVCRMLGAQHMHEEPRHESEES